MDQLVNASPQRSGSSWNKQTKKESKETEPIHIFVLLSMFPLCSRRRLVRNAFNDLSSTPSLIRPEHAARWTPKTWTPSLISWMHDDDCWWLLLILCSIKVAKPGGGRTEPHFVVWASAGSCACVWGETERGDRGVWQGALSCRTVSEHACCGGNSNTHQNTRI